MELCPGVRPSFQCLQWVHLPREDLLLPPPQEARPLLPVLELQELPHFKMHLMLQVAPCQEDQQLELEPEAQDNSNIPLAIRSPPPPTPN